MRYLALACGYDGTLAHDGLVASTTLAALRRLLDSGRRLILVTGRERDDLQKIFPHFRLFVWLVVENGAVLYDPARKREKILGGRPSQAFIDRLSERGVEPLAVGRVIVATWQRHETAVRDTIRECG